MSKKKSDPVTPSEPEVTNDTIERNKAEKEVELAAFARGFRAGLEHAREAITKRRRVESARGVHAILDELVRELEQAAAS